MTLNVGKELAALSKMTVAELREKYAEVCGEPTRSRHKDYLIRRIAWHLQPSAEGDLSERARRRGMELAAGADVRLTAPREKATPAQERTKVATPHLSHEGRLPMPGAVITREYKGQTIEVRVLPHGFELEGEVYTSLSVAARWPTTPTWPAWAT